MSEQQKLEQLLERILANQEQQLARQAEALQLQREQFEMARVQFDRAERINERAEKIQETGAGMMAAARKAMIVILPIILFLVIYLTWLIFR